MLHCFLTFAERRLRPGSGGDCEAALPACKCGGGRSSEGGTAPDAAITIARCRTQLSKSIVIVASINEVVLVIGRQCLQVALGVQLPANMLHRCTPSPPSPAAPRSCLPSLSSGQAADAADEEEQ